MRSGLQRTRARKVTGSGGEVKVVSEGTGRDLPVVSIDKVKVFLIEL